MAHKILIADDEEVVRELVVALIEFSGFIPVEAVDGSELFKKAVQHKPDLIITDILMPGISGYRAVEQLRKQKELEHTPVIFCSGVMKDQQTFKTLKPSGPCCFLPKPFDKPLLIKTIKEMLDNK